MKKMCLGAIARHWRHQTPAKLSGLQDSAKGGGEGFQGVCGVGKELGGRLWLLPQVSRRWRLLLLDMDHKHQ